MGYWFLSAQEKAGSFLLKVNKKRATNGVGGKWQVEVLFEINLDRKYEDLILKLQRFCPASPGRGCRPGLVESTTAAINLLTE